MMFQRVLLSVLFAFPCMLVTIEAAAQEEVQAQALSRVDYPVRLNPNARPNESAIAAEVSDDKKCRAQTHDGCMYFTKNTVGKIDFYVQGSERKTGCSDEGVQHVITKIELSTTRLGEDDAKGDFSKKVAPWLTKSAFDNVNKLGVVYEADKDTGRTSVALTNWNSHDANEGIKPFWYRVTVTKCSDETTKIFDPRGDNEGLH